MNQNNISLEKVIKGLECCTKSGFGCLEYKECPYNPMRDRGHCVEALLQDALVLLKAQESEAMDAPKPDSDIGCWYDITHNYTLEQVVSALKAQEPKPPIIKENSYGWKFYYCPSCGKEFYQNIRFNFCEKCGQAVKWE